MQCTAMQYITCDSDDGDDGEDALDAHAARLADRGHVAQPLLERAAEPLPNVREHAVARRVARVAARRLLARGAARGRTDERTERARDARRRRRRPGGALLRRRRLAGRERRAGGDDPDATRARDRSRCDDRACARARRAIVSRSTHIYFSGAGPASHDEYSQYGTIRRWSILPFIRPTH